MRIEYKDRKTEMRRWLTEKNITYNAHIKKN